MVRSQARAVAFGANIPESSPILIRYAEEIRRITDTCGLGLELA
tara:strand:+ start:576 stop:707 length:132 start_codon:yes stop_codon:yes gene_type:complete